MRYIEDTTTGLLGVVDFGNLKGLEGADALELVLPNRSALGGNVFLIAEGLMLSDSDEGVVAEGCRSRIIHTRPRSTRKTSMYIHDMPNRGIIAVYASHPAVQILLRFSAADWNDRKEVLFNTQGQKYRILSADGRALVKEATADEVATYLNENEFGDDNLPKIEVI